MTNSQRPFVGRATVLARLADALLGAEPQVVLVAGGTGSGKSALLGHVRALMAGGAWGPAGGAPVARSARDGTPGALAAALPAIPGTLLLDDLDRAADPAGVAELLEGLAGGGWRIVAAAGSRSAVPGLVAPVVVDLDDGATAGETDLDVAELVRGALAWPAATAAAAADLVAYRARGNFLVAELTARLLSRQPPPDLTAGWRGRLGGPSGVAFVGEAVEEDLAAGPEEDRAAVHALLTALAHARGAGVPEQAWPALAAAVTGGGHDAAAAAATVDAAGWYVTEPAGADRLLRLRHEPVARHLRAEAARTAPGAEGRIATWLAEVLDDAGAVPELRAYAARHLGDHAAAAGTLAGLARAAGPLAAADPAALDRHLGDVAFGADPLAAAVARTLLRADAVAGGPAVRSAALLTVAHAEDREAVAPLAASTPAPAWRTTVAALRPAPFARELAGHRDWVWDVAFGRVGGRLLAASGSDDHTVRVWDPVAGRCVRVLRGHTGGVSAVAFGVVAGREVLASAGFDGTVRLWDVDADEAVAVIKGGERGLWGVAFGEVDGRPVLATAGADYTARVWDPERGTELAVLRGHEDWVWDVAFSDGELLASVSDDATARVWDPRTGQELAVLRGHEGGVSAVTFTFDGLVATSGFDGTVRLWRPSGGDAVRTIDAHGDWVRDLAAVEGRLATASDDRTVRLWRLDADVPARTLDGHGLGVTAVALPPPGSPPLLASAGFDERVRVWAEPAASDAPAAVPARAVAVGRPEGRVLAAAAGDDGEVALWDLGTGQPAGRLEAGAEWAGGLDLGICKKGYCTAIGGFDGVVRLLAVPGGEPVAELAGHELSVSAVRFGGGLLATGSFDATVRLWAPDTGDVVAVLTGHTDWVWGVAVASSSGRPVVASAGADGTARVWDASGAELAVLEGHEGAVTGVCFAEWDGRPVVATSGADGTVRIWPRDGGEPAVLAGHDGRVAGVAAATVGGRQVVVSCGADGTVRLWQPGREAAVVPLPGIGAGCAASGEHVVAGSDRGLLAISLEAPLLAAD